MLAQLESRCSPGCEWVLLLYASMIGVEMWENHTQAAAGKTGLLALSESECISENVRLLEDLGLKENGDILMARATSAYKENAFKTCYKYSKTLIERDPFNLSILPVHICTLVELELKSELFYLSHQLVDSYPENGVTWFSVGCYYYLIQRFDMARRLFNKATTLEPPFLSGWIAYGHSFSLQDESDQAIAAYRTAARLFEGNHAALLFIGMEYAKSGNSLLAQQFFQQAMLMHVKDPMVYNEMGVIAFRDGLYEDAVSLFLQTLEKARGHNLEEWEPTLFNLGHAFRKVLRYDDAIHYYEMALSVSAKKYSVESALGFTHHLKGDLDKAIEYYHRALSTQPRETFTSDMLGRALSQFADTPVSDL